MENSSRRQPISEHNALLLTALQEASEQIVQAQKLAAEAPQLQMEQFAAELGTLVQERNLLESAKLQSEENLKQVEEKLAETTLLLQQEKEQTEAFKKTLISRDKNSKLKLKAIEKDVSAVIREIEDFLLNQGQDAHAFLAGIQDRLTKAVSIGRPGTASGTDDVGPTSFVTSTDVGAAPVQQEKSLTRPRSTSSVNQRSDLPPIVRAAVSRSESAGASATPAAVKARSKSITREISNGKFKKPPKEAVVKEVIADNTTRSNSTSQDINTTRHRRRSSSFGESTTTRRSVSLLNLNDLPNRIPSEDLNIKFERATETESKSDVMNASKELEAIIDVLDEIPVDPKTRGAALNQDEAARIIQRVYRYHRVRSHFHSIIRAFASKTRQVTVASLLPPGSPIERKPSLSLLSDVSGGSNNSFITAMTTSDQMAIQGVYQFNEHPKKGLRFLLETGYLSDDDDAVAKFLRTDKRLNKTKVGEFLGLGEEFSERIKERYIVQIDFSGLDFDLALRKFLSDSNFRLPGEAQKIDRLVESFARSYVASNPDFIFANQDAVHVLAYSTIMLNTDAHNPNVKKRMTHEEFIRNNRGINNKQDLPEEFLRKLYVSIVNNEIRIKEDDQCARIFETVEGFSQIDGLYQLFVEPFRRFIREFDAKEIPDQSFFQPNQSKPERHLFIFCDVLLIVRQQSRKKKNEFRKLIHYIRLKISDMKDSSLHKNVVELSNPDGRVITLLFSSIDEKMQFISTMKAQIAEVAALTAPFHDKLRSLCELASSKTSTSLDRSLSRRATDLRDHLLRFRQQNKIPHQSPDSSLTISTNPSDVSGGSTSPKPDSMDEEEDDLGSVHSLDEYKELARSDSPTTTVTATSATTSRPITPNDHSKLLARSNSLSHKPPPTPDGLRMTVFSDSADSTSSPAVVATSNKKGKNRNKGEMNRSDS